MGLVVKIVVLASRVIVIGITIGAGFREKTNSKAFIFFYYQQLLLLLLLLLLILMSLFLLLLLLLLLFLLLFLLFLLFLLLLSSPLIYCDCSILRLNSTVSTLHYASCGAQEFKLKVRVPVKICSNDIL